MDAAWWRTIAVCAAFVTTFRIDPKNILGLFTAALGDLGIRWTRPNAHSIAVYRKAAVARLDEFVGPKS